MNIKQVRIAVNVLMDLFYSQEMKNQELAYQTMEFYISHLNFLRDIHKVADVIEEQRGFALLTPIRILDVESANQIEDCLRGI